MSDFRKVGFIARAFDGPEKDSLIIARGLTWEEIMALSKSARTSIYVETLDEDFNPSGYRIYVEAKHLEYVYV